MPSVGTHIAQPVTRSFAITQGPNQVGVYYWSAATIDAWYASNAANVNKVSDGLYVVTGNFNNIMYNMNNDGTWNDRKTLIDFGKEIIFGNEINSRLLVLRRVQFWADAAVGGDGREAYVVVENNTNDLAPSGTGRFTVRVART